MLYGPADFAARWSLQDIGSLAEVSFETPAPSPGAGSFSISLWFQSNHLGGTHILLNHGDCNAGDPGWSLRLEYNDLLFHVTTDAGAQATARMSAGDTGRWRHVVAVIDRQAGELALYLDAAGAPTARLPIAHSPISPHGNLIVGGYTDSAGGYFDYTFGRQGGGWISDLRLYPRLLTRNEAASFRDDANRPPVARFSVESPSSQVPAPSAVGFNASTSTDEDGAILTYLWDFGDGATGMGESVQHTYVYGGEYAVSLTVVDDDHGQGVATARIVAPGSENPLYTTPVFVNGAEGYACYRIPSIVRAANGVLVAFAEGRVADCSDATPVSHIVCKRSQDNGATWQPLQVVARNIIDGQEHVCINPSPVVDDLRGTGRILVVFNKQEYTEFEIAQGKGVARVVSIASDDHGRTWGDETDITFQVHKPYNPNYAAVYPDASLPQNQPFDWRKQVPTLGHAIQLQGVSWNPSTRGRFFFAGAFTGGDDTPFFSRNYAFWSDDLGRSWQIGGVILRREDGHDAKGLNEATVVELENGDVMVNSRHYEHGRVVGRRAITIGSFDRQGAITFGPVCADPALVDSAVQASLIRYTRGDGNEGRSRLLFSNPAHPRARVNLTVRLSYDEGKTWPVAKTVDPGPAAYSDLVIQADGRIGVLYERGNRGGVAYINFSLEWLTDGQDRLAPAPKNTGARRPSPGSGV